MDNIHKSESDLLYLREFHNKYQEISSYYDERIRKAAPNGQQHIKDKIYGSLRNSHRKLYSNAKLQTDITNHYKYDLLNRFKEVMLEQYEDPVNHFIKFEKQKLRRLHKEHNRKSKYSYSYDNEFFNATDETIIQLLSHASAIDKYEKELYSEKNDDLGITEIKQSGHIALLLPETKRNEAILLMHSELEGPLGKIPLHTFKNIFEPNIDSSGKIQWHANAILLVHWFYELERLKIIPPSNCPTYVSTHFINKKGEEITRSQVSTQYQAITRETRGRSIIDVVINKLAELVKI